MSKENIINEEQIEKAKSTLNVSFGVLAAIIVLLGILVGVIYVYFKFGWLFGIQG